MSLAKLLKCILKYDDIKKECVKCDGKNTECKSYVPLEVQKYEKTYRKTTKKASIKKPKKTFPGLVPLSESNQFKEFSGYGNNRLDRDDYGLNDPDRM